PQPDLSYPVVNGSINVITPDGTGGYYVGGSFTSVGGMARTNLAHVRNDKSVNPNWNPGTDAQVNSIAVLDNKVFVAGNFTKILGETRTRLAAVDAMTGEVLTWNPVPDDVV